MLRVAVVVLEADVDRGVGREQGCADLEGGRPVRRALHTARAGVFFMAVNSRQQAPAAPMNATGGPASAAMSWTGQSGSRAWEAATNTAVARVERPSLMSS